MSTWIRQSHSSSSKNSQRNKSAVLSPYATEAKQFSLSGKHNLSIPPKLAIGAPDDPLEIAADRVADDVMRDPGSEVPPPPIPKNKAHSNQAGLRFSDVRSHKGEHGGVKFRPQNKVQAKAHPASPLSLQSSVASEINALSGGGKAMSQLERNFFEPRIGYDFSRVRIHADGRAANMARAINARAFTFGRNVVFGAGQYQPYSRHGRRLIAHELAHVVQQSRGGESARRIQREMVRDRGEDFFFKSKEEAERRLKRLIRVIENPKKKGFYLIEWRWNPKNPAKDKWNRGDVSRTKKDAEKKRDQLMRIVEQDGKWFIEKDTSLAPKEPMKTSAPCKRFASDTKRIIKDNPRKYPGSVVIRTHVIASGETLAELAQATKADNRVTVAGQLAAELKALNSHVTSGAMKPGDCVLLLKNWKHPKVGKLPAGVSSSTKLKDLSNQVKRAIATVYSEQWNTGANAQNQQKYIWYSIRLRIGTSLRGATLKEVVNSREYHGIGGPLYNAAKKELDGNKIKSTGVKNAKNVVLSNYSNSVPGDAGVYYFHWTTTSTSQGCFDKKIAKQKKSSGGKGPTSAQLLDIEKKCARLWAEKQGWDANLTSGAGWHKRIRGDKNVKAGSMYIYRGF